MSNRNKNIILSKEEARLIAHISADGSIYTYNAKRSPSDLKNHKRKNIFRVIYGIDYYNTQKYLLEQFIKDVKKAYGIRAYKKNNDSVHFSGKWIFERAKKLGAGKSFDWFISDEILNAKKEISREWIKAFFDDEAHVELRNFTIVVNSVNKKGLKQIRILLKRFNIKKVSITGPYYTRKFPIYRLIILKEDVERYKVYIGFYHKKKINDLNELLELRSLTY